VARSAARPAGAHLQDVIMSLDPASLLLSLAASCFGLGLFVYGKKQGRMPQLVAGLAFMVYPYFTPSVTWLAVVGLILGAALWWAIRLGW
jgi:hypothetical protein